ncbi:MAG: peptidyl-prolyl cis-trans isomerase [Clostridiales bacterium]|nr:peptidyl-prolyl cis-trans isomerase [Clostridiales bacterium]
MGKKKDKLNYSQILELKKQTEQKEKRKRRLRRVIIPCVTGGLILALIAGIVINGYIISSGILMRGKTVMSTEHFKVDEAMMSYYAQDTYNSYLENFSESLSSDGLDTATDLASQQKDSDTTWRDYFLDKAEEAVKDMLIVAEAAYSAGYELGSDEEAKIDEYMSNINIDEYPKGVSLEDIRRAEELYTLAISYDEKLYDGFKYTDEQLEQYYKNNENKYKCASYRYYSFSYSLDSDESDFTLSKEEATDYAKRLQSCKNEDEFTDTIARFCREWIPDITDEQIQSELNETKTVNAPFFAGDGFNEWAFNGKRKVNDVYYELSEEYQTVSVYMLTELPHRREESSVNVRHILFTIEDSDFDYLTLEQASTVLTEWELSGKTTEKFDELAAEYSDDKASAKNGGLYENVIQGETVTEFDSWCFDKNRKPGDYEIIKTDYGYHIMYFVSTGEETWKIQVQSDMISEDYDKLYDNLREKYDIEISKDYRKNIKLG